MIYNKPFKCRVMAGWEFSGRLCLCYGTLNIDSMWWAIVLWEDEEDPDLIKLNALEKESIVWEKFDNE